MILTVSADVFACHSASCRPPTSGGTGGSISKGGRGNAGIPRQDQIDAQRRASGKLAQVQAADRAEMKRKAVNEFPAITKAEARGDSRPVSHEEFQRLARIGQAKLDKMSASSSPTTGLDRNWSSIKASAYTEVRKSWGGATIDSHTGQPLPQGANKYAITVKSPGLSTVSVHEGASATEFSAAMDRARKEFGHILEREGHYLGVFHDDEHHRIDIDPVLVVSKRSDVDTIGAATHAIGGAYNFADGNGYWPPHVV